jgi:hypothetical protein
MNKLYYKILIMFFTSLTLHARLPQTNQMLHTMKRLYSTSQSVSHKDLQGAVKRLLKMSYQVYCQKMQTGLSVKMSDYPNPYLGDVTPEDIDAIMEKEYRKELTRDYTIEKETLEKFLDNLKEEEQK